MKELNNKNILVVDDSATMRLLISMTIKRVSAGITVTEAVNGIDAVKKLRIQYFDLVLTDMIMPEMDGSELIKQIRNSLRMDVPIIIITTKGGEEDRDKGLNLGANGYVTKPIAGHELKEMVLKCLLTECRA
jgi:CheY-like chemotaxis protein